MRKVNKEAFLPKIMIEGKRDRAYRRALATEQRAQPSLTLSEWVRRTLDREVLAAKSVCPVCGRPMGEA